MWGFKSGDVSTTQYEAAAKSSRNLWRREVVEEGGKRKSDVSEELKVVPLICKYREEWQGCNKIVQGFNPH